AGIEDADEQFGQLTDADLRYLRGFAFNLCGRWSYAEDIRNDALAKAYEKRKTYAGTTHDRFIAWLAGFVRNFARRHVKRKTIEHAAVERAIIIADGQRRPGRDTLVPCADMIEQHRLLQGDDRPDVAALKRIDLERAVSALHEVVPDLELRGALVRFAHGDPINQIAADLRWPRKTLETRITAALNEARNKMKLEPNEVGNKMKEPKKEPAVSTATILGDIERIANERRTIEQQAAENWVDESEVPEWRGVDETLFRRVNDLVKALWPGCHYAVQWIEPVKTGRPERDAGQ